MFKKSLLLLTTALTVFMCCGSFADTDDREVTIMFTHDIHDYYYSTKLINPDGSITQHGGAARLASVLQANASDNMIYVDAGDFSMGTLLQASYTDALELKILGQLGCAVTTFGNHEFDYGAQGVTDMLNCAADYDGALPAFVSSNVSFEGELTDEQKNFKAACDNYGITDYYITEVNGVKIAFFGLMGLDSIECSPTSGQNWDNYIIAAKQTVEEIGDKADVIVALSHSGTNGDGKTGEDIDLAKAVPGIDIIISGHTHTQYDEAVMVGDTIIGSQGCYLTNVGKLTFTYDGKDVALKDYELIRIDESIAEDPEMAAYVQECIEVADENYVKDYGYSFNEVVARSPYTFTALANMYATHEEYPMGNLIADSYIYEAEKNGIDDIDVALVGLGTIRNTFAEGDITTADVFEACSLGVGSDGSAGHPLIYAYITGKELKLLVELDASLGTMVDSIKMSYSGLEYTFNEKRIILDRVTDVKLVNADGERVAIDDKKLYKVCCNKYAANMLGMLNSLTKGILSISLKDADGNVFTDLSDYSLIGTDGREIKEWVALADYISSMEADASGVPVLSDDYSRPLGRKVKVSEGGLAIFANPHGTTLAVLIVAGLIVFIIVYRICTRRRRAEKRARKRGLL
ncbi:MAG: 5'-nucleotidase C-terminal domain-containing protein [Lachnospiraceae bacterium]|nr:5'-nucleotidase C-terminal domain-containing protein [Lachnospiraceae bacterium]